MRLPFLLLGAGGYGVGKSIEYHLTDVNTDSEAKGSLLKTILDFVALSKSSNSSSGSGSLAAIDKRLDELSKQVMYMSHSVGRYVPSSTGGETLFYVGGTAVSASLLYAYCRLKGIEYGDIAYVSKNFFDDAIANLKSGVESVSNKVKRFREYFEQRILQVEAKVDESTEKLEKHIEVEVGKVGDDVEKVCQMQSHLKSMVGNLSDKVDQIEGQTRFSSRGIYLLCNVVSKNIAFTSIDEKNRNELEDLRNFTKVDPSEADSLIQTSLKILQDSPSKDGMSGYFNGSLQSIDCTPIRGHIFDSLYYGLPVGGKGDSNVLSNLNNEELKSNQGDPMTPTRRKMEGVKPPGTV